jgi:hypothetical protein
MFLFGIGTVLFAQDGQQSNNNDVKLRVEITTGKKDYRTGERIRFRAVLVNIGHSDVYISKSFTYAGGGIAGFYVNVKQITGKRSKTGCGGYGDRFPLEDRRSPEQILREDYLLLSPEGLIGFEGDYEGCEAKYPGTYEIQASYSAQDSNLSRVLPLNEKGKVVLTGQVKSQPVTFSIQPKRENQQSVR